MSRCWTRVCVVFISGSPPVVPDPTSYAPRGSGEPSLVVHICDQFEVNHFACGKVVQKAWRRFERIEPERRVDAHVLEVPADLGGGRLRGRHGLGRSLLIASFCRRYAI